MRFEPAVEKFKISVPPEEIPLQTSVKNANPGALAFPAPGLKYPLDIKTPAIELLPLAPVVIVPVVEIAVLLRVTPPTELLVPLPVVIAPAVEIAVLLRVTPPTE
jgi:hypothetical protein